MNLEADPGDDSRYKQVQIASHWTEGRGWLRAHMGNPNMSEALMQSLGGFHQVIVWHEEEVKEKLKENFGENVDPLQAIRIVIASLDSIDPSWRNTSTANKSFGEAASTVDFIDYLLRPKDSLPLEYTSGADNG